MAKVFTTKIDRFNGGMVGDPRTPSEAVCRACTNYDVFRQPRQLVPHFGSEDGDNETDGAQKQNFAVGKYTSSPDVYNLFSLGVQSGNTDRAKISRKTLLQSGTESLLDASWTSPTNSSAGQDNTVFDLFTYYPKTGLIYGAHTGTHIWAFDPSSSASFDDTENALSYTEIGEGVVHSDDNLYIPCYNSAASAGNRSFIAKNDNGSWTNSALALPDNLKPVCVSGYGSYLAIACNDISSQPLNSVVLLWNRRTTIVDITEKYDWGGDPIAFIEELEGTLVGASARAGIATSIDDYVSFKYLTPNGFKEFERFDLSSTVGTGTVILPSMRQKVNGRVYFQFFGEIDGTLREGIWSIKRGTDGEFSVALEYTPSNNTAITSGVPKGFLIVGDFVFQAYTNGGTYVVRKTQESTTYTSSRYETTINPQIPPEHRDAKKQLMGVRLAYEKLSANSVTLSYRVDGATAWTQLLTANSDDDTDTLYKEFNGSIAQGTEYEFRLESTGAIITGLTYKYSLIDTQI